MAVPVGLKFDLSEWNRGCRDAAKLVDKNLNPKILSPFQKALRARAGELKSLFSRPLAWLRNALTSAFAPILGIASITGLSLALKSGVQQALDYERAIKGLRAAFETLPFDDAIAGMRGVSELADKLVSSLAVSRQDTATTFATFLTRQFTERQARQLTILAANYASKTGKPIREVAKAIADAANGSVEAIKELGIQIAVTGNKTVDAEAAVLALKAAYGTIGDDLTNPFQRARAAWNDLLLSLGTDLLPIIGPMAQSFSDFVVGLTQTKIDTSPWQGLIDVFHALSDAISGLYAGGINSIRMLVAGFESLASTIKIALYDSMASAIEVLTSPIFGGAAGQYIAKQLGIELDTARVLRKMMEEEGKKARIAVGEYARAATDFVSGEVPGGQRASGGLADWFAEVAAAGAKITEANRQKLRDEMEAGRGETFSGGIAQQQQRTAQEAARKAAEQSLEGRARAYSQVRDTPAVLRIAIMATRPDVFRSWGV